MKKILSIISMLALSMTLVTLTSCQQDNNPDESKPGDTLNPDFVATHTLNEAFDAVYSTHESIGIYSVTFGTAPAEIGHPTSEGDVQFTINLYADLDSDPMNAAIPNGKYTGSTDMAPMTWNPIATGLYVINDGNLEIAFMTEGTVYTSLDGDTYTIQVELKAATDNKEYEVKAQYVGPIVFAHGGSSTTTTENFETDPKVAFDKAEGVYYGSYAYHFSDDVTLRFSKDITDEDGNVIQSYHLNAMIWIPKLEDYNDPNPQIPSGTYDVIMKKTTDATNIPMTVSYGFLGEMTGELFSFGSLLSMTDYKEGKRFVGYFTEGSMELVNNNGNYEITFNFKTPEGLDITGSYNGAIKIENRCNNDEAPNNLGANGNPLSKLTDDVALEIPEDEIAMIYHYGNYIFPNMSSWFFSIGDSDERGDFIMTEIFKDYVPFIDGKDGLAGTYTVSRDFVVNTLIPGTLSYGNNTPSYSYYGDLDSYDETIGAHSKMAPIVEGTLTITDIGNGLELIPADDMDLYAGTYSFTFDFTDDKGYKITGEWSGTVAIIDYDLTIEIEQ